MKIAEALEVLETTLSTNWTSTPIAYENVEQRNWSQIGQPLLPDGDEDYIAVRTDVSDSRTITVPGSCIRYFGAIYIAICVKDGTGTRVAAQRADTLIALLESKEIFGAYGMLRLWNLAFNTKYRPSEQWFVQEIGFNFSFERYTR